MKSILKSDWARSIACWAILNYIRLVRATGRWSVSGFEHIEPLLARREPFIFAFWHSRILMTPYAWPYDRASIKMMISQHRDGDLIARSVAPFGVESIRGSSAKAGRRDKGALAALRAMAQEIEAGGCVGITPDGPKGPRMRAAVGAAHLARLTGAPVAPFAYSTSRGRTLKTWDRFLLAAPFSRGHMVWGAPIYVDRAARGEDMETARSKIEEALNAVTAEADRLAGRPAVEPDATPSQAEGAIQ
ncbi:MAG: lysophospholipid acyltransferase family protein [Pseudomonadota bacterium]